MAAKWLLQLGIAHKKRGREGKREGRQVGAWEHGLQLPIFPACVYKHLGRPLGVVREEVPGGVVRDKSLWMS